MMPFSFKTIDRFNFNIKAKLNFVILSIIRA